MSDLKLDPFIDDVARELRRPVSFDAGFDDRVMSAITPPVLSITSRRQAQPWYRRSISISITGLAAAAAFAGIVAFGTWSIAGGGWGTDQATATTGAGVELTHVAGAIGPDGSLLQNQQFLIVAPDAQAVSLVGQFNGWDPQATPMTYDAAHGAWHVTVPLAPGLYQYQFLLDGARRVADPAAPQVASEFGSPNSLVTVRPAR
ncbi:MAG: isoamylase early set domain-containing protein [Gemmatimonadota bacterium]